MDTAAFLAMTPAERERIIAAFDPPETLAASSSGTILGDSAAFTNSASGDGPKDTR